MKPMIEVGPRGKTVYINNTRAVRLYTGSARKCFVGESIIVKVKHKYSGWEHDDRKVYKRVEKEDRIYFAPIIASGRDWIAQPYYAAKRGRRPLWAREMVSVLVEKYDIYDTDGDKNTNWMMLENGQPLIYDYGLVW